MHGAKRAEKATPAARFERCTFCCALQWQPWDLRKNALVKVTCGPGKGYVGKVLGRRSDGHIRVRLPCQREGSRDQGRAWTIYILGSWWLETAVHGKAAQLPLVNTTEKPTLPLAGVPFRGTST